MEPPVETPRDLPEAFRLLALAPRTPIAGGTDLLVSMKHRLFEPTVLVSTRRLGLRGITESGGWLEIGAATTLREVARHATVNARLPALAAACRTVATPTIQAMATLGGNLVLDTRCMYYNQPAGWRDRRYGAAGSNARRHRTDWPADRKRRRRQTCGSDFPRKGY